MALLSNILDTGKVFPYIEVAHVMPLSAASSTYQVLAANACNQIFLNQKLYDTDNLGTFTASTSTLSIPAGRWAYKIKTSIYNSSNVPGGSVGLSSAELNDIIGLESANAQMYYAVNFNNEGEFISTIPYTLSLVAVMPTNVANCLVGTNLFWTGNASYPITGLRQSYKRASLKLWKLK